MAPFTQTILSIRPTTHFLYIAWSICQLSLNLTLLNWHDLFFDELTIGQAGRVHWSLVDASGVFRIWQRGGPWRACRARAYNGGLGADPPAGSRGRAPSRRVRGRSPPLKLKHFLLLNVQWKPQIRPFFLKFAGKRQKMHHFHMKSPVKNFYGRAKGGGHRTMVPLNTPLVDAYVSVV